MYVKFKNRQDFMVYIRSLVVEGVLIVEEGESSGAQEAFSSLIWVVATYGKIVQLYTGDLCSYVSKLCLTEKVKKKKKRQQSACMIGEGHVIQFSVMPPLKGWEESK